MSRRDRFHEAVRNALEKDGWRITHDPYPLVYGTRNVRVDLGAEAPLGAEKEGQRIAVEVKSFVGLSEMSELEKAVGQFVIYALVLETQDPERQLYLAVPEYIYAGLLSEPQSVQLRERCRLKILVYKAQQEEVVQWIN